MPSFTCSKVTQFKCRKTVWYKSREVTWQDEAKCKLIAWLKVTLKRERLSSWRITRPTTLPSPK